MYVSFESQQNRTTSTVQGKATLVYSTLMREHYTTVYKLRRISCRQ